MKAYMFLAFCCIIRSAQVKGSCTDSIWSSVKQEYGPSFEQIYKVPAKQHVPYCFMTCAELKANGYCAYQIGAVCSSDPNFHSLPVRDHCKKTCEHPDCQSNDCQWSSWSNTGQCSDQCRGVVIKSRTVLIPAKNGGSCVGNKYENEPCNENPFGPMGADFEFLGNGWCRDSSGKEAINAYFKDHSNPNECKLKCLNEPSCTGYAISDPDYSPNAPSRCFVHGCLRPESFNGWEELSRENFWPIQSSHYNKNTVKCYKRNK